MPYLTNTCCRTITCYLHKWTSRMCTARYVSHNICHAWPPAMHAPCHTCPLPPCHACPLPCTPPAMHAPATHALLPCMPPCHACLPLPHMPPLPCMPPAMHTPCHAHPPLPCIPPAMHAPCHACPCHVHPLPCMPPPVDEILDTRFWKYYLAPTSLRAVKTHNIVPIDIKYQAYRLH